MLRQRPLRVLAELETGSKQIGEIVSVINDIADQTNLLAECGHRSRSSGEAIADLQPWQMR